MKDTDKSDQIEPEVNETEGPKRRPYRKPEAESRGRIKPSLMGSPPDPPFIWHR